MLPREKVQKLNNRHHELEEKLATGNIDKKKSAKESSVEFIGRLDFNE